MGIMRIRGPGSRDDPYRKSVRLVPASYPSPEPELDADSPIYERHRDTLRDNLSKVVLDGFKKRKEPEYTRLGYLLESLSKDKEAVARRMVRRILVRGSLEDAIFLFGDDETVDSKINLGEILCKIIEHAYRNNHALLESEVYQDFRSWAVSNLTDTSFITVVRNKEYNRNEDNPGRRRRLRDSSPRMRYPEITGYDDGESPSERSDAVTRVKRRELPKQKDPEVSWRKYLKICPGELREEVRKHHFALWDEMRGNGSIERIPNLSRLDAKSKGEAAEKFRAKLKVKSKSPVRKGKKFPGKKELLAFLRKNPDHQLGIVELYKKIGFSPLRGHKTRRKLEDDGLIRVEVEKLERGWKKFIRLADDAS